MSFIVESCRVNANAFGGQLATSDDLRRLFSTLLHNKCFFRPTILNEDSSCIM